MKYPPIQYPEYLQLDKLLTAQKLRSEEFGKPAHEEMLFIIVHQTYELWFKQILFDLDSILASLNQPKVPDSVMGIAVSRIERIVNCIEFLLGQIDLLETMTPLDFLEFRDFLFPASGFQSLQWRLLETKLGLKPTQRLNYTSTPMEKHLQSNEQDLVQQAMNSENLFSLVEKWLERTPFVQTADFDFWNAYQTALTGLLDSDIDVVMTNAKLSDADKQKNKAQIEQTKLMMENLFSEEKFSELQKTGYLKLSYKAFRAALFILLYRDEPVLQMPFRLISSLLDVDEAMTQWRSRHALMAHRMLGRKIGTGGSSGHEYLSATIDKHKVFSDFFNLTTFLIPRSAIPELPISVKKMMSFQY